MASRQVEGPEKKVGGRRPGAGRKIQKKMPVIGEDGSVSRPSARGSKAVQPPPAFGAATSRLPLSRGADGLRAVAATAVGEFWEKVHYYQKLQAELEKLYLWFEDFEQRLNRETQELEQIRAWLQALHGLSQGPSAGPAPGGPLERGTEGLAAMATTAIGEFRKKFHHYHRLQAELEKLYLWFEEFERILARDNEELERILAEVQAISEPSVVEGES